MSRERPNAPAAGQPRRTRNGSTAEPRSRRRGSGGDAVELSDEELRALADENIDPEEVLRASRDDDEQEASEHDRDTARDRIEGMLLEQDEDY